MTTHDPLLPAVVLQRKAVVYVRQSMPQQVQLNLESQRAFAYHRYFRFFLSLFFSTPLKRIWRGRGASPPGSPLAGSPVTRNAEIDPPP